MKSNLVDDCFQPNQPRLRHADALAMLRRASVPLPTPETLPLHAACGRILAEAIVAAHPVPAHTNSAVDGYAFLWTQDLSAQGARLQLGSRAAAGRPLEHFPTDVVPGSAKKMRQNKDLERRSDSVGSECALAQHIDPSHAARIFTGAVMPDGLDTVVMQEDTARSEADGQILVAIPPGLKCGANVRLAGEDVATGTTLFAVGHIVRPQDLAALASLGRSSVSAFGRMRVAIVSTGDEIVTPGSGALSPGQVYDANAPMLAALAALAGADVDHLGIWPDTRQAVTAKLQAAAASYDLILTTGGASLGEEDHIAHTLAAIGRRHMWQLAIKPGRPMMFGQIRTGDHDTIVIGLPGNPVAVFVCFLMYVFPYLRALGGAPWAEPQRYRLPAAFSFSGRKIGRREFWRGRLSQTDTAMTVEKFNRDGSGLISGLRWSDGLIDIPEDCGDVREGDPVAFIPFSQFGMA